MITRTLIITLLISLWSHANAQCFLVPTEVCVGDCGPLFYLQDDPDGTTYQWSISCGTITNDTSANPHVVCFLSSGECTIQVIIEIPGEEPDTCSMTVNVLSPSLSVLAENICQGDSIEINGVYYTGGFYTDTILGGAANGCDSILFITVNELEIDTTLVEYTGCEGDGYSVVVNSVLYDESNPAGTEVLTGSDGCDSIVIVDLIFLTHSFATIDYIGCEGDSFNIIVNNVVYNELNPNGVEVLVAANGCDSVVTINMTFLPTIYDTISYQGCSGDGFSITIDSIVYDESNPFGIDTLEGGCDTIIIIDLHFDTINATLTLNGNQMCVSPAGLTYTWMTCDSTLLPDTASCVTLAGTGCICVIVDYGTCIDTVCQDYAVCELACEIISPSGGCVGDSILLVASSNGSDVAYDWTITFDPFSILHLQGDSVVIAASHSGEVIIELQSEELGCIANCNETILFTDPPLADLCCTDRYCDSAVLTVHLFGQPPFTIEISDGVAIDTVSGIMNSQFEYTVYAPYFGYYTLLSVLDSSTNCYGGIINDSVQIEVVAEPELVIVQTENTLCIEPTGFAYNWTACNSQVTLAPGRCFTPDSSGCYCAYITTGIIGCADTECIDFVLVDVEEPAAPDDISIWYDKNTHGIFVRSLAKNPQFQLFDVLGREISYSFREEMEEGLYRLSLNGSLPSFVFVAVSSKEFRHARSVFIPGD